MLVGSGSKERKRRNQESCQEGTKEISNSDEGAMTFEMYTKSLNSCYSSSKIGMIDVRFAIYCCVLLSVQYVAYRTLIISPRTMQRSCQD